VELGIFDHAFVKRLVEEHLAGRVDHNFRLWILLNLELWYRMYFENRSVDQMREFTDELLLPR
jgi:asparagine synthase (glutamine-hydrolysing)